MKALARGFVVAILIGILLGWLIGRLGAGPVFTGMALVGFVVWLVSPGIGDGEPEESPFDRGFDSN